LLGVWPGRRARKTNLPERLEDGNGFPPTPSNSYTDAVRVGPIVTLPLIVLAMACGGMSKRTDVGEVPGGPDAGAACAEPDSGVPDAGTFEPPPLEGLSTFPITFHNRCAQTVWPAWGPSGGLDNTVIDTELWFPLSPGSDRTVTGYSSVQEIGFWGRTGCSFDEEGAGSCATGECGGFVCPIVVNGFPPNTTVFFLQAGFLGGYNVGLRVEGTYCGDHECVADLHTCPDGPVTDRCGSTIACGDVCGESTPECCTGSESGCSPGRSYGGPSDYGDLVVTFCP
jgi:hypothetical protein